MEYVDVYQRYAAEWFVEKNDHFAYRFFPLLAEYGLISVQDWKTYVEGDFFEDFYMTDLVKYRVRTGDINPNHLEKSYELQLQDELQAIDLDLVFSFSSRMWKTLHSRLDISAISDDAPESNSVSKCHGYLYSAGEPLNSLIIPLAHYSRRVWGQYLRDSYFNYLNEGLQDFDDH